MSDLETTPRFPNIGRLGIALLEHFSEPVLGKEAINEIKAPAKGYELKEAIKNALQFSEKRFVAECSDSQIARLVIDFPLGDTPSVIKAVQAFVLRPTDSSLIRILSEQLSQSFPGLKSERIEKAIQAYVQILREELSNISDELREKLSVIASLRMQDDTARIADTLQEIQAQLPSIARIAKPAQRRESQGNKPKDVVEIPASQLHILISYSHTDRRKIRKLENLIRASGIKYFLDEINIEVGEDLVERVRTGIESCTHFLVYISPASLKSQWVLCEIGIAWGLRRNFIPYLDHPSMDLPAPLRNLKYITSPVELRAFLERLKSTVYDTLLARMSDVERHAKDVLYYYPGGFARAIRLFCADDEYIPAARLEIRYTHESLISPPDLVEYKRQVIEKKRQESEQRNALFFNGPNVRLIRWRANPKGRFDLATEENTLELHLGPVGWYDFVGLNEAFRETGSETDTLRAYEHYTKFSRLIKDGDVSGVLLSNILDTATTIVSLDGYVAYQERGQRVSSVPGLLTSAVAENVSRYLDDTILSDWTALINPDHFAKEERLETDNDYCPRGIPHPFATVKRGIREELSPSILSYIRPQAIKLTGLSFDLESNHPDILFLVCVDLSKEAILDACRKDPGKDWLEGKLHFARADFRDKGTALALEQKWVPAGKASLIRAITLLNSLQRKTGKGFDAVFEMLASDG